MDTKLLNAMWRRAQEKPEAAVFEDIAQTVGYYVEAEPEVRVYAEQAFDLLEKVIPTVTDEREIRAMFTAHKNLAFCAAKQSFRMFCEALEWNREPKKKFYHPRRKALRQVVDALQDLEDGKLDLLTISMPPGAGKTTTALFYLSWIAGRYPDLPTLTGSHSNAFIRGAYDECLRIMDPQGEYTWAEIFKGIGVSSTNAKDCRIDVGTRKRFETLQFTSIGTGNAGLYRAAKLLYCDDLVSGIEVALSKERLDKLWETYTTDLRQRKIGDCKELHIATRWSVHDIIGRLEQQYGDDEKSKFIVMPALDENDESNFNYPFGVGFSTEFYHRQREIMDDVSFRALYQGIPIEREGLLYHPDELQYYFDLPDKEPDNIIAVCDTKDKGQDYAVMPVAYQYGQQFFIEDFICDNSNPDLVVARLAQMLLKHHVHVARFESNSAGGRMASEVQTMVKEKAGRTKITTKFSTANKETRIITGAGVVKDRFLFKDKSVRSREYETAMKFLLSYTMSGKNKHDDVPDAMSMLVDYIDSMNFSRVEVFKRPF